MLTMDKRHALAKVDLDKAQHPSYVVLAAAVATTVAAQLILLAVAAVPPMSLAILDVILLTEVSKVAIILLV